METRSGGWQVKRRGASIKESGFPGVDKSLKTLKSFSVHLLFRGNDVPLPHWLINDQNGKLSCFSMLDSLPAYLRAFAENDNLFKRDDDSAIL